MSAWWAALVQFFEVTPVLHWLLPVIAIACFVVAWWPWGFLERRKVSAVPVSGQRYIEPLLTRPDLTIKEVKLPDGTTLTGIHGDAPPLAEEERD